MRKTLDSERHKALVACLARHREAKPMTQSQLADALGEWQSFVARLESGQRRVDVVELLAICAVLDVDPATVLAEVEAVPAD